MKAKKKHKSIIERLKECYRCPYFERCKMEVEDPEEYPDGSCMQKDVYKTKGETNNG